MHEDIQITIIQWHQKCDLLDLEYRSSCMFSFCSFFFDDWQWTSTITCRYIVKCPFSKKCFNLIRVFLKSSIWRYICKMSSISIINHRKINKVSKYFIIVTCACTEKIYTSQKNKLKHPAQWAYMSPILQYCQSCKLVQVINVYEIHT